MGMTGIAILNVILVAAVVGAIVALLAWSILMSMKRHERQGTSSRPTGRVYYVPEVALDEVEREGTVFVSLAHLDDPGQIADVGDARSMSLGM
jgi:flagellar basal body-associated protein FliL